MITKHNLFTGGVITVLTAGVLFTVGQKTLRKPKAEGNPKRWPGVLSGSIGGHYTQSRNTVAARLGQAGRPDAPAELIGRTGYPLYR